MSRPVPDSSPAERAVLATAFVVLAGFGIHRACAGPPPGAGRELPRPDAPAGGSRICFDVAGASGQPGLRCVPNPPSAAAVEPLAPCDDAASLRQADRLLRECPLHGRQLLLAPERSGGPCVPRLVELPGATRLLLGSPIDLRTARRADLEALPGVGPRLAAEMQRVREERPGRVDLEGIAGLGPRRRAVLERRLTWSAPPAPGCGPAEAAETR